MIFVDAFERDAIEYVKTHPFISGITTNPLILRKAGVSFSQAIDVLLGVRGTHFAQISIYDHSWKEFLSNMDIGKRKKFVLKIPWDIETSSIVVEVVKSLGFKSCATAVYTMAQFISSMVLNVDYVAIYYDRMKRNGLNPDKFIEDVVKVRGNSSKPRVIVASLKRVEDVDNVLLEGADDITLPLVLCREYFKAELPENDIEVFERQFRLR